MTTLALDTSVAIPLLVRTHREHAAVAGWWDGRDVALVALAAVEHDADLATRDVRAKATYEIVGARVVVAA
ncbi:MAG: hypothetical protein QOI64_408 [Solirubrobacteraceae bacterium]|nr:hypothetical protein [Solirubrobacteraceae bacterium]